MLPGRSHLLLLKVLYHTNAKCVYISGFLGRWVIIALVSALRLKSVWDADGH